MQIVEDIDFERRKARISQRELCRRSGVHPATYQRMRCGLTSPRLSTVMKLRQALDALQAEGGK